MYISRNTFQATIQIKKGNFLNLKRWKDTEIN